MTSRPGESLSIVVADANALLAILTGLAASKALATPVRLHTARFTWDEAMHYLPSFVTRYGVDPEIMKERSEQLDIRIWEKPSYRAQMVKAAVFMKDPDDVELAALALHLKAPVWSNDNHFKDFPTGRYTTAEILKKLGF